jgi:phosphoenolpyruvate synthase/pyruvate phosphate dikinase
MVRSSAIGEDSREASFAGQLDSFVSDGKPEAIMENVRR